MLASIVLGAVFGWLFPHYAEQAKPLGDIFVRLVRMIIAPIVFVTVSLGVASMGDVRKVGRVGIKALVWFELMTTVALALGLIASRLIKPGAGMHVDPAALDMTALDKTLSAPRPHGFAEHIIALAPDSIIGAFAGGDVLQVLVIALIAGFALAFLGERGKPVVKGLEHVGALLFTMVAIVMLYAPFGAFGAMAYTVGKHGVATIGNLIWMMVAFYATALTFVLVVLGLAARAIGFNIFRILAFIREELLLVLGTSSSESALPSLMAKLEGAGIAPGIVRLVVPTGYSFNLDGTCIYLTMAVAFIAQAMDIPLSLTDELGILGVLLLTSKGAAGVTGSGFVTLAATLSSIGHIPVSGLTLLLGIDRFMSECRALTNVVGNTVATLVVARWENAIDDTVDSPLHHGTKPKVSVSPDVGRTFT